MTQLHPRSLWLLGSLAALGGLPSACKGGDSTGGEGGEASGGHTSTGGHSASGGQGGDGGAGPTDECLEPSGPGTEVPSTISEDQVWDHDGSPYIIRNNVLLTANLELEKCTVVRLAENVTIEVRGSLTARGKVTEHLGEAPLIEPVSFMPLEEGKAWGSIDVDPDATLDVEATALVGGGAREATIHAWGNDQYGLPHRNVRMLGSYIGGSVGPAIFLETRAAFSEDSTDLEIEASGSAEVPYPIVIEAGTATALPTALTLTNNRKDEIFVDPVRQVHNDVFKSLGYPYVIGGRLLVSHQNGVASGEISTLLIEPGVTLRMQEDGGSGLVVGDGQGYLGRLIANGTPEFPIRFESAKDEPGPGDWLGIYFSEPVSAGNMLSHVQIAHAGGPSGAEGYGCGPKENNASILILDSVPVPPFIENCTIESAGGDTQILLGWDYDGDPSGSANAIFEANTFDDSGPTCQVSLPQNSDSQCPGLDSDPDCL